MLSISYLELDSDPCPGKREAVIRFETASSFNFD
jgi:hypothetical protein